MNNDNIKAIEVGTNIMSIKVIDSDVTNEHDTHERINEIKANCKTKGNDINKFSLKKNMEDDTNYILTSNNIYTSRTTGEKYFTAYNEDYLFKDPVNGGAPSTIYKPPSKSVKVFINDHIICNCTNSQFAVE